MIRFFAGEMNESDRRLLTVLLVIFVILFIVFALFGLGVRALLRNQGKKVDSYMYQVVTSHVASDKRKFHKIARKKNNRLYFKQSSPAVVFALIATLFFVISFTVRKAWGSARLFDEFGDLFFKFDFSESFVKFWGLRLIGDWPKVSHYPSFVLSHLCSYIAGGLFVLSITWYVIASGAYMSRMLSARRIANKVYSGSLEDFNMNEDLAKKNIAPIPPSDTN